MTLITPHQNLPGSIEFAKRDGGRKVAVLGDMLELGQYEQIGHEMVGFRAAEVCDRVGSGR